MPGGYVSEGKLPLPGLLQERVWHHSPSVVRGGYLVCSVDFARDEWGCLQRDVSVQHVSGIDLEEQGVRRSVHLPEAPQPTPIDESRQNTLSHGVTGPDARGVAAKDDGVVGVVAHSTERLHG